MYTQINNLLILTLYYKADKKTRLSFEHLLLLAPENGVENWLELERLVKNGMDTENADDDGDDDDDHDDDDDDDDGDYCLWRFGSERNNHKMVSKMKCITKWLKIKILK
uniref:Uncharacterized protein n=1 Tax=Glossina pallidipes TaxID=7398 RepID=A0A1A9ZNC8_GLOPL